MHPAPLLVELTENTRGRDFVVADLHGHIEKLECALDALHFDAAADRVLAVGDLIDRGPSSLRALSLLAQPWFFSVRGNHEQAMLAWVDALMDGREADEVRMLAHRHFSIGGDWALALFKHAVNGDLSALAPWQRALAALPYAIATRARDSSAGIVHACVPGGDWQFFHTPEPEPKMLHRVLWSRQPSDESPDGVRGIDTVFAGHNLVSEARRIGNFHMIETGAWQGHALTIAEIGNWPAAKESRPSRLPAWLRRGRS
jgi:serine/threonine protein phosphatase 1